MNYFHISNLDYRCSYFKKDIITKNIGYFTYKNIPFIIEKVPYKKPLNYKEKIMGTCFLAAILMLKRNFLLTYIDISSFINNFTIYFIRDDTYLINDIILIVKSIIDGKYDLPIYYPNSSSETMRANKKEGIYCHFESNTFCDYIEIIKDLYLIKDINISTIRFNILFNNFMNSSRLFVIALYYYVRTARCMQYDFIEEAGINIQLSIEALIEDYMILTDTKNKATASKNLINSIKLPYCYMDVLIEQREFRNSFLAHFDRDLFTENENINDPDNYCYEKYEPLSCFLMKYLKFKKDYK